VRRLVKCNSIFEFTGSLWVEAKISQMDSTLKIMQEKLATTERDIEELLFKRKANIQYSSQNDATLNQVLNLIDPSDKGENVLLVMDIDTVLISIFSFPFSYCFCEELHLQLFVTTMCNFDPDSDAIFSIQAHTKLLTKSSTTFPTHTNNRLEVNEEGGRILCVPQVSWNGSLLPVRMCYVQRSDQCACKGCLVLV
jgi:hypothetical protein